MYRPLIGRTGTLVFDVFVELLELTAIVLGFYAVMHTSSAPLIEDSGEPALETQLFVNLAISTRVYVIAAMSTFVVVVLLRSGVRRLIQVTE